MTMDAGQRSEFIMFVYIVYGVCRCMCVYVCVEFVCPYVYVCVCGVCTCVWVCSMWCVYVCVLNVYVYVLSNHECANARVSVCCARMLMTE